MIALCMSEMRPSPAVKLVLKSCVDVIELLGPSIFDQTPGGAHEVFRRIFV